VEFLAERLEAARAAIAAATAQAQPAAVPIAVVYAREQREPAEHGRWVSWLTNPVDLPNETLLYAQVPAVPAKRDISCLPSEGPFCSTYFRGLGWNECIDAMTAAPLPQQGEQG
jgi:hypothetical protein